MLTLNFNSTNFLYNILPTVLFVIFGMGAMMSFLPAAFKTTLLSFDNDGMEVLGFGGVIFVIGLIVPDYAAAYAAASIGLVLIVLGGFIWMDDGTTKKLLKSGWGILYLFLALAAFVFDALKSEAGYNVYALIRLVLPIAGAAMFATAAAFAMSSETFKARVLPMDKSGIRMLSSGLIMLCFAPMASRNPALTIGVTSLGMVVFTLGGLVALRDKVTKALLNKWMTLAYVVLAVGLVVLARMIF